MMVQTGRKKVIFILLLLFCTALCAQADGQQLCKGEWRLPDNYPPGFNGWGRIDRLSANEVVINDVLYALAPAVTYNATTANGVPASWFRVGDVVGYVFDSDKRIASLWKIPE